MPTGYTATICEKTQSFEDFALDCSRAFGALIEIRDEPNGAPIPERFEPSDYAKNKQAEAEARFEQFKKHTPKEQATLGAKLKQDSLESLNDWADRDAMANARIFGMRAKVEAWTPPTADHQQLKTFMLEQLDISLNDLNYINQQIASEELRAPMEFYKAAYDSAKKDCGYYAQQHAEEVQRTEGRNEWLAQLRASLTSQVRTHPQMITEIPTPRTDQAVKMFDHGVGRGPRYVATVSEHFARELERETIALRQQLADSEQARETVAQAYSKACEENETLREQVARLTAIEREELEHRVELNHLMNDADVSGNNLVEQLTALIAQRAAATALQNELVDALAAMNAMATLEGWNTPVFAKEFGEALRSARATLARARPPAAEEKDAATGAGGAT